MPNKIIEIEKDTMQEVVIWSVISVFFETAIKFISFHANVSVINPLTLWKLLCNSLPLQSIYSRFWFPEQNNSSIFCLMVSFIILLPMDVQTHQKQFPSILKKPLIFLNISVKSLLPPWRSIRFLYSLSIIEFWVPCSKSSLHTLRPWHPFRNEAPRISSGLTGDF